MEVYLHWQSFPEVVGYMLTDAASVKQTEKTNCTTINYKQEFSVDEIFSLFYEL